MAKNFPLNDKHSSANKEKRSCKINNDGRIKKRKPKQKKSIHANTFEERQENRRRKELIAQKKQKTKERHATSQMYSSQIISEVTNWAKDNPLHPSVVAKPTQQNNQSIGPFSREKKTFKALLKSLPFDVTPQEIDEHFYSRKNVHIHSIKLLVHRKTERCLGWGFLEFKDKLEYEKALTQNFTLLKGRRILIEQCLRTFVPSKRKPQKLVPYNPPKKIQPQKERKGEFKDGEDGKEVQILENQDPLQILQMDVN